MSRDRDEAMLFYGPILAWDIIMAGPVAMTLCFHSRGRRDGGEGIKEIESSGASMAEEHRQQISCADIYQMQ